MLDWRMLMTGRRWGAELLRERPFLPLVGSSATARLDTPRAGLRRAAIPGVSGLRAQGVGIVSARRGRGHGDAGVDRRLQRGGRLDGALADGRAGGHGEVARRRAQVALVDGGGAGVVVGRERRVRR
jgi:hypothetical protein